MVTAVCLICLTTKSVYALKPNQIMVIANKDSAESMNIAEYYCAKRNVPAQNIIALPLGKNLTDTITREDYEKKLAEPIRKKLLTFQFACEIRCLLTTYGVAFKVAGRGPLKDRQEKLKKLQKLAKSEENKIKMLENNSLINSTEQKKSLKRKLTILQSSIDAITGKQTSASVDSELSMVLFDSYELYRWKPNNLRYKSPHWDYKSLMVSRLDGPTPEIARKLIDKALAAEKSGLKGTVYIDSRGIPDDNIPYSSGCFDQSLRKLAVMIKTNTTMPVIEENTNSLFAPGKCPSTALYCGWYSLKKYVDAFEYVDGAVGYHIASWEAIDIRDPNSTQWCPAMLGDGITATLGAVAEPYLHAFPKPDEFFAELFTGRPLVEAFYRTKPFNSWQLMLLGDPLYTPFKKPNSNF